MISLASPSSKVAPVCCQQVDPQAQWVTAMQHHTVVSLVEGRVLLVVGFACGVVARGLQVVGDMVAFGEEVPWPVCYCDGAAYRAAITCTRGGGGWG